MSPAGARVGGVDDEEEVLLLVVFCGVVPPDLGGPEESGGGGSGSVWHPNPIFVTNGRFDNSIYADTR